MSTKAAKSPGASAVRWKWAGVFTAAAALLASGAAYRGVAGFVNGELAQKVRLPTPLAALPTEIGDWRGEDVALPAGVQRIAGNDDFVNRQYRDVLSREAVALYVGYTARPRTMLRHRPTVCYPSAGHSHVSTQRYTIDVQTRSEPVLVHRFFRPGFVEQRTVVLNYYILNGEWTIDENSFWGVSFRSPNLARDANRYVAQVQIIAPVMGSEDAAVATALEFAAESAADILRLLPGTILNPGQAMIVEPSGAGQPDEGP